MLPKLLLFIKTPPPITGATLMNQRLHDSLALQERYVVRSILISYSKRVNNFGKINFYKLLIFLYAVAHLVVELCVHRPDLIYFQISPTGPAFFRDSLFVLLMKIFRVKIVFHLRGRGIEDQVTRRFFVKLYYRMIFKNIHLICLSELLTGDVSSVTDFRPFIVYNGIPELKDYKPRDLKSGFENGVKLLFLSNLIITKGVLDFIEAIKILKEEGFSVKGTIVGAEADLSRSDIQKLIFKRDLVGFLEYRGAMYGKEKEEVLYDSDIFVFPTYYPVEAFPGVVLEAMQFELPVITTKECSLPVIVRENETGLFVEKKSPEQIANAIKKFIIDFEFYKTLSANSRKRFLEHFTFSRYEKDIIRAMDKILGKNHG